MPTTPDPPSRQARYWNHERRVFAGALLIAVPGLSAFAIALYLLRTDSGIALVAFGVVAIATLALAQHLRRRVAFPLYTLANLLEALREGDYSLRGSRARRGDAIGEVVLEINALSETLRTQRLAVEEKSALLARVIATLDIAILAFDAEGFVALANPSAGQLLGSEPAALAGRSAHALGLARFLAESTEEGGARRIVEHSFAGASGRWDVRCARFRENGLPHDLLVITDLSRALREEERLAWQRLLRVLGHELNNSLAPIRSMAATLSKLIASEPLPEDWREDAGGGLGVSGDRAESLARFMARYTKLARLPPPSPQPTEFGELARRAAALEQRVGVSIDAAGPVHLAVDPDQIEQALINLIQNATDAALAGGGHVVLRWRVAHGRLTVDIIDDGPGLPPSENLFVPFFTTKPGGSGIGLVLARQIVEAHGGSLALLARDEGTGCIARVQLGV
jgi:nitrogen fixation/metabolism regulation signal transduction histidine kinase